MPPSPTPQGLTLLTLLFFPLCIVNSTLSFNISTSWTVGKVNIHAFNKPAPKVSRQALWKGEDNKIFYIWGGRTIRRMNLDKIDRDAIWRFTANDEGGGQWSSEIPNGIDDDIHLPQRMAVTTYKNIGFALGGTVIGESDPSIGVETQPVPGMIRFDMDSKTFSNLSTPDVSPAGTSLGSTAEYVPDFGPDGIVMVLGGYAHTRAAGSRTPEHTRRFDNITYFNPKTEKWGWQMTTGNIPSPRLDHCSVGVKSGQDTYEM